MSKSRITVVCSFPRCGSTLLMSMLDAGGMPIFVDKDDTDTVFAYETRKILSLPGDSSWVGEYKGKALKVLEPFASALPTHHEYNFIWIDRDPAEQAKSQKVFWETLHFYYEANGLDNPRERDRRIVKTIMRKNAADRNGVIKTLRRNFRNSSLLLLNFETLVTKPKVAVDKILKQFPYLDSDSMVAKVIPRSPKCQYMKLELELVRGMQA